MWPSLLLLRINRIWLPLPLFLLWPLLMVVIIVAGCVSLVSSNRNTRFVYHLLLKLGTVRGLHVAVQDKQQQINIQFI